MEKKVKRQLGAGLSDIASNTVSKMDDRASMMEFNDTISTYS